MLDIPICVQGQLAFAPLLEVLRGTEIDLMLLAADEDICMNQLILQMGNAQNIQQTIHDDLVDTFMPDNAGHLIEVGELVVGFFPPSME